MIAPRQLPLGDGIVGKGVGGEGEMMIHHSGVPAKVVKELSPSTGKTYSSTETDIVDHNMQELEWEEGWYENGE